jgi:hypothetical protein
MSEVAPNLAQDIIDIAWLAADNANFAHTALTQAKAAREQVQATANLGLTGITISPEAYTILDEKIQTAEQEFDLFGSMAAPVMLMENSPFGGQETESESVVSPQAAKPAAQEPHTSPETTQHEEPAAPAEPAESVATGSEAEVEQPAAPETPAAPEASQSESSAPSEATHRMTREERNRKIKQQYTKILGYVIARTDKEGTYAAEDLAPSLQQELGVSAARLRKSIDQLEVWKCITATRDAEDDVTSITIDAEAVDRAIIKQRIVLFPNEKTATNLMKSRQHELSRLEDEAEQPAASSPTPKATPPTTRVSARVRRQMERDAANQAATAATQDRSELLDEELAGLAKEVENLSPEQYQKIAQEPLKQVVLAFLDESILTGPVDEKIGAQLTTLLPLAPEAIAEAYREMRSRDYLERTPAGDVQQPPVLTAGARHFVRNILQQATALS